MKEKKWLTWAKEIQGICQAGLQYSKDPFDIERFEQLREISVDIIANYTEIDHTKVRDLFANEEGYQTPKVDARAVIFKESKLLLVKEKSDNKWALPGGWADIGITLKENLIKESLEEAGAVVKPRKIIMIHDRNSRVFDNFPYSVYKIFVLCDYISDSYIENIETTETGFFTRENLPELSIVRNTGEEIEECFKFLEDEKREAIFD